jgi:hypothetical protein
VVLLLEGFQSGLYAQMERALLRRGADLVVVQSGVENFLASRSKLPQKSRAQVERVPGVLAAMPLTMVPIIYEAGERRSPILLVVHQQLSAVGFPIRSLGAVLTAEAVGLYALSLPLALGLALAIGHLVERGMPLYAVDVWVAGPLLRSFLAGLGLTLLASLAPLLVVRRLDPADAFRSLA